MNAPKTTRAEGNPPSHQVCLLLGSNIQPERNLPLAVEKLRARLTVIQISFVWETASVGSLGPNFLNAALLALTSLDANDLKAQVLLPLETQMGRQREADKNAPRPIDLDIIAFDDQLQDPILWQDAFRAVPVSEILPDIQNEAGETLKTIAARLAIKTPMWFRADISLNFP